MKGSYDMKTDYMQDFLPGTECDEIQCNDVTGFVFRGLCPCRKTIKTTMPVNPSVHTHEITIKPPKEFKKKN